jgi:hypothetical protein
MEDAVMRDRDVRNAIVSALTTTGAFDSGGVWITGLPEDSGAPSSDFAAVAIEPVSSTQEDRWDSQTDGGLIVTSRVTITVLNRNADAQLRDEGAEMLLDMAADALNGQSLAGLTLPGLTRFMSWTWQPPMAPERRIAATFTYSYIVEGWDGYDTTS